MKLNIQKLKSGKELSKNEKAQTKKIKNSGFYSNYNQNNAANLVAGIKNQMINAVRPEVSDVVAVSPIQNINPISNERVSGNEFAHQDMIDSMPFSKAFALARKYGLKEFTYKNKPIAVKLAGETTSPVVSSTPNRQQQNLPNYTARPETKYDKYIDKTRQRIIHDPESERKVFELSQVRVNDMLNNHLNNLRSTSINRIQNKKDFINRGTINKELGLSNPGIGLPRMRDGGKLQRLREIAKHQQGGSIENANNQYGSEELFADFAIRLLSILGVAEEDIMVGDKINPDYENTILSALGEVNTPEFWEAYSQDPDTTLSQYLSTKQKNEIEVFDNQSDDPEISENVDIEFAKKGTNLKRLRQYKTLPQLKK